VKILAIDPGTRRLGYAVVEVRSDPRAVAFGVIESRDRRRERRLLVMHQALAKLCAKHRPDEVAIEQTFVGKNPRAAVVMGEGRGMALLAAAGAGASVHEYAPSTVKKSVSGSGRALKGTVQERVKTIFGLAVLPPEDAADALALAWCHANRRSFQL
jgi:crossover junction endodeoxyribonuclease RuvC